MHMYTQVHVTTLYDAGQPTKWIQQVWSQLACWHCGILHSTQVDTISATAQWHRPRMHVMHACCPGCHEDADAVQRWQALAQNYQGAGSVAAAPAPGLAS